MSSSRQTVYSGQQGQTATILQQERDTAKSLFAFANAAFGSTNAQFFGLAAAPLSGLSVSIGTGSLWQYNAIDPTSWSTLPADTSQWLLQGLVTSSQTITGFAAPAISGDSITYLLEAQIQVQDTSAVSTPFYNSANPAQPVYQQKSPNRQNVVVFQVKAGTAAPTGTQTSPAADSGWVPLYTVTVDYGETQLQSNDIALASGAPQFTGFVHNNPNGNTPVYLSPAAQQSGFINVSGNLTAAGSNHVLGTAGTGSLISIGNISPISGSAKLTQLYSSSSSLNGVSSEVFGIADAGNIAVMAIDHSGNVAVGGYISATGGHAGTDADPYPLSPVNAAMLGGKLASDYALAGGNYITVYSGSPTLATGNAGITGQFTANAPQGTAPFIVQSTTLVSNLNANYVGGYAAGNSSGSIPISNGTLCSNLNAQYLNGLASSAFQPAGNYAQMNVANSGTFTATASLVTQGGTGSSQTSLNYSATNGFGLNSGGALSYIQAMNAPLGLVGSSVRTNGPVYVGDATPQNAYMKDTVPSGLVRSGVMTYRVTRGSGSSNNPAPVTPGSGTDYGYWPQMGGGISYSALGGSAETITWRTVVTFASSLFVAFNIRANDAVSIYIDGVYQFSQYGFSATQCVFTHTFSAGSHTIDITYSGDGSGDDRLVVFPWVPMPSGSITSAITSAVPG